MSNICEFRKTEKPSIFLKTLFGVISALPSKFICKRDGGVLVKTLTNTVQCVCFPPCKEQTMNSGDRTFCQSSNITLKKDFCTFLPFLRIFKGFFFLSSVFIISKCVAIVLDVAT